MWPEPVHGAALAAARQEKWERTLPLLFRAHPHYRRVFAELDIEEGDLRSYESISRLPVTQKDDFMRAPEDFRLQTAALDDVSVPERTVAHVVHTTGTTSGRPAPFYDTNWDYTSRVWQLRELCTRIGVSREDTVANLFPLGAVLHQGFLTALHGPLAVGAKVITGYTGAPSTPFGVYRSTAEAVELIAEHRPTVLWGIAGYVARVVAECEAQQVSLERVRLAFLAGEPAGPEFRKAFHARLERCGATDVELQNGYGFTEMQGPSWHCAADGPFHVPTPEQYFIEVVDPDTHAPVPDGEEGLVLVSHLNRRGTVLLRYAMGDLCALEHGPCPNCGLDGPRFAFPPRRTGRLLKVKGTLINSDALLEAVSEVPGVAEFQVRIGHRDPGDVLSGEEIRIEFVRVDGVDGAGDVAEDIRRAAVTATEITPTVVEEPKLLERLDGSYKFKRLVDERAVQPAPTRDEEALR